MFVVVSTTWGYKIGHCSLDVIGLFETWDEALAAAMEVAIDEEDEKAPLPADEADLLKRLNKDACIWDYAQGNSAMFWTGCDDGSLGLLIEQMSLPEPNRKKLKSDV